MPRADAIACVVLAAGQSKRMKSPLPKVVHRLGGRALITHVLTAVGGLMPERVLVVIPPEDETIGELVGPDVCCVVQQRVLGTGHALMQSREALSGFRGNLLVLCGDAPLITTPTLRRLVDYHRSERLAATILTARLTDPTGYGRVHHKSEGRVAKIVEEADADFYQKVIEAVNSGTYCFNCPDIWPVLEEIKDNNRQGEYYLTDAIQLIVDDGGEVGSVEVEDAREIWGVNTRRQLAQAEEYFQARVSSYHQDRGVTIVLPRATYIEAGVEIGPDTVIEPFTVIKRGVRIGRNCRIGPSVSLKAGVEVPDGTEITK